MSDDLEPLKNLLVWLNRGEWPGTQEIAAAEAALARLERERADIQALLERRTRLRLDGYEAAREQAARIVNERDGEEYDDLVERIRAMKPEESDEESNTRESEARPG